MSTEISAGDVVGHLRLADEGWTSGIHKAETGLGSLSDLMGPLAGKLNLVSLSFGGVAAAAVEANSEIAGSYRHLNYLTGATGEHMQELRGQILALARDEVEGFGTIGQVVALVSQRTQESGEEAEKTAAKYLSIAHAYELSAESITRTGLQVQMGFGVGSEAADKFVVARQQSGAGIDSLMGMMAEYGANLRNMNYGFDESLALLANFEKKGVNSARVLAAFRMALFQTGGDEKEFGKRLKDITDMTQSGNTAGAVELAKKTFGTRGMSEILDAIRRGAMDTREMTAALNGAGDAAVNLADKSLKGELARALHDVQIAAQPLGKDMISVAKAALPVVSGIAKITMAVAASPVGKDLAMWAIGLVALDKGLTMAATSGGRLVNIFKGIQAGSVGSTLTQKVAGYGAAFNTAAGITPQVAPAPNAGLAAVQARNTAALMQGTVAMTHYTESQFRAAFAAKGRSDAEIVGIRATAAGTSANLRAAEAQLVRARAEAAEMRNLTVMTDEEYALVAARVAAAESAVVDARTTDASAQSRLKSAEAINLETNAVVRGIESNTGLTAQQIKVIIAENDAAAAHLKAAKALDTEAAAAERAAVANKAAGEAAVAGGAMAAAGAGAGVAAATGTAVKTGLLAGVGGWLAAAGPKIAAGLGRMAGPALIAWLAGEGVGMGIDWLTDKKVKPMDAHTEELKKATDARNEDIEKAKRRAEEYGMTMAEAIQRGSALGFRSKGKGTGFNIANQYLDTLPKPEITRQRQELSAQEILDTNTYLATRETAEKQLATTRRQLLAATSEEEDATLRASIAEQEAALRQLNEQHLLATQMAGELAAAANEKDKGAIQQKFAVQKVWLDAAHKQELAALAATTAEEQKAFAERRRQFDIEREAANLRVRNAMAAHAVEGDIERLRRQAGRASSTVDATRLQWAIRIKEQEIANADAVGQKELYWLAEIRKEKNAQHRAWLENQRPLSVEQVRAEGVNTLADMQARADEEIKAQERAAARQVRLYDAQLSAAESLADVEAQRAETAGQRVSIDQEDALARQRYAAERQRLGGTDLSGQTSNRYSTAETLARNAARRAELAEAQRTADAAYQIKANAARQLANVDVSTPAGQATEKRLQSELRTALRNEQARHTLALQGIGRESAEKLAALSREQAAALDNLHREEKARDEARRARQAGDDLSFNRYWGARELAFQQESAWSGFLSEMWGSAYASRQRAASESARAEMEYNRSVAEAQKKYNEDAAAAKADSELKKNPQAMTERLGAIDTAFTDDLEAAFRRLQGAKIGIQIEVAKNSWQAFKDGLLGLWESDVLADPRYMKGFKAGLEGQRRFFGGDDLLSGLGTVGSVNAMQTLSPVVNVAASPPPVVNVAAPENTPMAPERPVMMTAPPPDVPEVPAPVVNVPETQLPGIYLSPAAVNIPPPPVFSPVVNPAAVSVSQVVSAPDSPAPIFSPTLTPAPVNIAPMPLAPTEQREPAVVNLSPASSAVPDAPRNLLAPTRTESAFGGLLDSFANLLASITIPAPVIPTINIPPILPPAAARTETARHSAEDRDQPIRVIIDILEQAPWFEARVRGIADQRVMVNIAQAAADIGR
jgi:hypothetical protein